MNDPTAKGLFRSQRRLPGWDYAAPGLYFVTICTHKRRCCFGDVVNGEMLLNEMGQIVKEEILKTSEIHEKVLIDSWVIMPNHIHLIIIISQVKDVATPRRGVVTESPKHWKPGTLGVLINQLKGACTRRIRSDLDPDFAWQARYYDHIIRTDNDLENLREYIQLNPVNWQPFPIEVPACA